jgi:hypothetical protein
MGKIKKTKVKIQMISQIIRGKTCAMNSSDARGEQQSLNSFDMTSETGLDLDRRSSLKSSNLDIGLSKNESPEPIYTVNPYLKTHMKKIPLY